MEFCAEAAAASAETRAREETSFMMGAGWGAASERVVLKESKDADYSVQIEKESARSRAGPPLPNLLSRQQGTLF